MSREHENKMATVTGCVPGIIPTTVTAQPRSAAEIMVLKKQLHVWHCPQPGCDFKLRFRAGEIDVLPAFIVRHLVRLHRIDPDGVALLEPTLADEIQRFCRIMKVKRAAPQTTES